MENVAEFLQKVDNLKGPDFRSKFVDAAFKLVLIKVGNRQAQLLRPTKTEESTEVTKAVLGFQQLLEQLAAASVDFAKTVNRPRETAIAIVGHFVINP